MGSIEEVEGEPVEDLEVEETVYVAVGKNIEKSQQLLLWAVHNCAEKKKICVLHVHRPERVNSLCDKEVYESEPSDIAIKEFQEEERQKAHELVDNYVLTLSLAGVDAEKLLIEMDSIEKGIVQAIAQHNIRWLVMGAAVDRYCSGELIEEKSKKAVLVLEQASVSCNIWFVYKGKLICTSASMEGKKSKEFSSEYTHNSQKHLDAENMEGIFRNFSSQCSVDSGQSNRSFNRVVDRSKLTDMLFHEKERDEQEEANDMDGRLKKTNIDDKSFRTKELAEALESLYANEIHRRRELEDLLAREIQELQNLKEQRDKIMCELKMIQNQNSTLNSQIVESQAMMSELEEKIISAVELLISFREQRDNLKIELANAVREVNQLKKLVNTDAEYSYGTEFPTFSFIEINEATNDFDPSWKIGDGKFGSIYKGLLRNVQVAIRMLPSYGSQSQMEFQHQVEVFSRVRHPNLLTLIGSCPESRSLVYDYLNNGSLEKHLFHEDKAPLPWQIRISIAADICSALIFLHSSKPCIVHGNLKPNKVLLDANFVSKLGYAGISSLVLHSMHSADSKTVGNNQNENLVYVDPEYLVTGKITPASDVYSFGIILLQLLTGRPLSGIVRDMKCALEKENLKAVLDSSAGEWPLDQAELLAHLALRCCEKASLNRPDLVSDIWSFLEPLRTLCISRPPYLTSKNLHRVPSHFVCPIFQEVMKDPYIAADGFTYEEDAIRGWLDSGHNTSPMTNLKLEHTNLVPNYALQNAIQEWQQHSNFTT